MDINHRIWSEKALKVCANLLVIAIFIFVAANYGQTKYDAYVYATEVPEVPTISLEKTGDNVELIVNSNETRENNTNIVYISEDGEDYEELIVSEDDEILIEDLELGKKYYFKVKVRVFYNEEPINSYASNVETIKLKKPEVIVVEESEDEDTEDDAITIAPAVANGTEAWADEVERLLVLNGVYTDERKAMILNIIYYESGGNEHAVSSSGEYVGLVQFGSHWTHDYSESYWDEYSLTGPYQEDNRYSGSWSINRIVQVIVDGGDSSVKQHWAATWNK